LATIQLYAIKRQNELGGTAKRVFELGGGRQNHPPPSSRWSLGGATRRKPFPEILSDELIRLRRNLIEWVPCPRTSSDVGMLSSVVHMAKKTWPCHPKYKFLYFLINRFRRDRIAAILTAKV